MPELVIKVMRDVPAPLTTLRPDVPSGLDAVVQHCLEKDRSRRYADVGELVRALVPFGPPRARLSLEVVNGIVHRASMPGSAFSLQAPPSERVALQPPRALTVASWGGTGAEAKPSRKRLFAWRAAVGLSGLTLAVAGALVVRRFVPEPRPLASDAGLSVSDAASESTPDAGVLPQPLPDAASPADAEADHREARDAGADATRDAGKWWTSGNPTATTPTTSPECKTPYFYDPNGNKVFKLGCLP